MLLAPFGPIPAGLFEDTPQRADRDVSLWVWHNHDPAPVWLSENVMVPFGSDQLPPVPSQPLNDLSTGHAVVLHMKHTKHNRVLEFAPREIPSAQLPAPV